MPCSLVYKKHRDLIHKTLQSQYSNYTIMNLPKVDSPILKLAVVLQQSQPMYFFYMIYGQNTLIQTTNLQGL